MIKIHNEIIKPTIFPDKTSQVWKLSQETLEYIERNKDIEVLWEFESEDELIRVCQLSDLVSSLRDYVYLILKCPYLPYARQDKTISNDSTFAKITFCSILSRFYDEIFCIDVHSNNDFYPPITSIYPEKEIEFAINDSNSNLICYPDSGAKTRYKNKCDILMKKVRDQSTGEIVGIDLDLENSTNHENLPNSIVIIVDDLCDGGRTFIETSKVLLSKGASIVNLYTTHGIYSKGLEVIHNSGIDRIYDKTGLVSCR